MILPTDQPNRQAATLAAALLRVVRATVGLAESNGSLFCFLAVLDPRVGHTMDVLSPFIPVLCHSD